MLPTTLLLQGVVAVAITVVAVAVQVDCFQTLLR
jgi:hypothetical protein